MAEPRKNLHDLQESRARYRSSLHDFDIAVCEALAVGQKQAGQIAVRHVGFATYIFAQMCAHSASLIRAAPLSRWRTADYEDWHFSSVAPHARAIAEGYLLFNYLISDVSSDDESRARINVMDLNDCSRRIDLFEDLGNENGEAEGFKIQLEELRERLRANTYFHTLSPGLQKACLSGRNLTILNRDEMVIAAGFELRQFNGVFDLWSQHTHILPLSFYRMEPNGRGTGVENETDREYAAEALKVCAEIMGSATNRMVLHFPETANVRQGVKSMFSPGPRANRYRKIPEEKGARS